VADELVHLAAEESDLRGFQVELLPGWRLETSGALRAHLFPVPCSISLFPVPCSSGGSRRFAASLARIYRGTVRRGWNSRLSSVVDPLMACPVGNFVEFFAVDGVKCDSAGLGDCVEARRDSRESLDRVSRDVVRKQLGSQPRSLRRSTAVIVRGGP
jgi:hypothetical protein